MMNGTISEEHQFLNYKHAHVHFVYSFAWDVTKLPFAPLADELTAKGWRRCALHDRPLSCDFSFNGARYKPSLTSKAVAVLHRSGYVLRSTPLIVPMANDDGDNVRAAVAVDLGYTIRLFESGAGVCTLTACLKGDGCSFAAIHHVIHLAHSVDSDAKYEGQHLTTAYLKPSASEGCETDYPIKLDDRGMISLHRIFNSLFDAAPAWMPNEWSSAWIDPRLFRVGSGDGWQNPYVLMVAEIDQESYVKLTGASNPKVVKEVGTFLCKMVLDNRTINSDFEYLGEDYIESALPHRSTHGRLTNLSLDSRLFFSLSRRGSVALTTDVKGMPGYFVVPSYLNLIEILRSRWHLANIVNLLLDEGIALIASPNQMAASEVLDQVFHWRTVYALFMQDPVPYLFDGGSVTEIAEIAEDDFWLAKLRDSTYRKMATLDRLVEDVLQRKRVEELAKGF